MEKQALRVMMMERRQALEPAERERLSAAAQDALTGSAAFAAAGTILLYIAFRGEVGTERIAKAATAAGKRLLLPRVIKEPRGLILHRYSGDPATLARGAYGVPEPRPDWPVAAPTQVDLAVVPGVAFDATGARLGYGGGYYDRLLPAMPQACLVGLAYSFQPVESLPRASHDVDVDGLATDMGYVTTRRDG